MKRIYCQYCGRELEVPDEIVDGQHILCPYCNKKFSYSNVVGASNNTSSIGSKGKNLWVLIGVIVIGVVITVAKSHFFPSDQAKLDELTAWYERNLNYNGLSEMEYCHNEKDQAFILLFVGDGKCIEWYPKLGMISHPRSMVKGFAEDLIKARVAIEILRNKLHIVKEPAGVPKATVIMAPEGLTEEETAEFFRKKLNNE